MPVHIFCGGVGDNVRTELKRTAVDRSANVLSTISGTLWLCAAEANFSKSRTAREGLAIVSPNTALVFGRKAASSSSAVQSGETNVKSMPIFFIVTAKRLYVPPYIAEEATTWLPHSAMLKTA